MSSISMMEARLPPGFRFHPRDDELVLDYLLHRLSCGCGSGGGGDYSGVAIVDVDLNKCEPWDLPDVASVGGKEWYFYSLRDRKYNRGQRTNRATRSGYWKATGKDRTIVAADDKKATVVGMRKTLVFYRGRAPRGRKTEWVMHEFRHEPPVSQLKEDWVLCRVFYKSRTTTSRPPSQNQASMPSIAEPDLPVAPPAAPLVATYNAFHGGSSAAEQVSCFSGLPALPLRRPVNIGDLLTFGTSEDEAIRTVLSSMSSDGSSGMELGPNWGQENGLAPQMWNRL